MKFFEDALNIRVPQTLTNEDEWFESFQRRHIIIHNGGRVNRTYLEKVDRGWLERNSEEAVIGKELKVSQDYVTNALNNFEALGVILCLECWQKLAPEELKEQQLAFQSHQYDCLCAGVWKVVEDLGRWALANVTKSKWSDAIKLVARINYWLAIKRQGRWSEIEADVGSFDTSVLSADFALALCALKDETDRFFELLPAARESGITKDNLKEWPVFEEMRTEMERRHETSNQQ